MENTIYDLFYSLKNTTWIKNGAKTEPLSIMSFRFASGNLLLYYKHGSLTSYMHDVLNCSYKYDDKKLFTWSEQAQPGQSSGRGTLYFNMREKMINMRNEVNGWLNCNYIKMDMYSSLSRGQYQIGSWHLFKSWKVSSIWRVETFWIPSQLLSRTMTINICILFH